VYESGLKYTLLVDLKIPVNGTAGGFKGNQVFENERKTQIVCVLRHLTIRGRINQMQ